MATWFNVAEKSVPNQNEVKPGTQYDEYRDAYMHNIDAVLNNGGRLDRIGFQCRIKRGRLTPELIYARLNEFSFAYGLEMVCTEFEVVESEFYNLFTDEYERAEITEETMTNYLSHPCVTGLNQWKYMKNIKNAMVYYDGTIKLNGLVLFFVHRIRYHTEESMVTDENGRATVREVSKELMMLLLYMDQQRSHLKCSCLKMAQQLL